MDRATQYSIYTLERMLKIPDIPFLKMTHYVGTWACWAETNNTVCKIQSIIQQALLQTQVVGLQLETLKS